MANGTVTGVAQVPLRAAPGDGMRTAILIDKQMSGAEGLAGGLMWVAPGGSLGGPDAEMSHGFDKVFYVVAGGATFSSEGKATAMQPGDVVTVPAGIEHHVQNDPDAPLQLFWCIGAGWGADGTEADEVDGWAEVDSAKGWHVE